MSEMELEESWKNKYFKSLLEQENTEQSSTELFNQLYRELLHVFEYFRGHSAPIDSMLDSLPTKPSPEELSINNLKDLNRQIAEIETITELLGTSTVKIDSDSDDISNFGIAKDSLEYLLDQVPQESFTQLDLAKLNVTLSEATDFDDLCVVIDSFKDVLSGVLAERSEKIKELSSFLGDIAGRLESLQAHLENEKSDRESSYDDRGVLSNVIDSNIKQIRESVAEAEQLEELQKVIEDRINEIDNSVNSFVEAETLRADKAEESSALLEAQMEELQQKSENLSKSLEAARTDATIDPLTGISNRRAYDERFLIEYARWKRHQEPLTMAIIDIDHFKNINDSYGHPVGDKVLKVVASRIQQQTRESDFFGRIGGEEFALLLVNSNIENAFTKVESLRKSVEGCNFRVKDSKFTVSISIGLATFHDKDTVEIVYNRADQALLKAKQSGRNRTISEQPES